MLFLVPGDKGSNAFIKNQETIVGSKIFHFLQVRESGILELSCENFLLLDIDILIG